MDIKKFVVGQTAYVIGDGSSRKMKHEYTEATVTKVGRVYVTVKIAGNWPMMFQDEGTHDPFLIEKTEYGGKRMLFQSKKDVEEWVERQELKRELRTALDWSNIDRLSIEQLRYIKKVIDGCTLVEVPR